MDKNDKDEIAAKDENEDPREQDEEAEEEEQEEDVKGTVQDHKERHEQNLILETTRQQLRQKRPSVRTHPRACTSKAAIYEDAESSESEDVDCKDESEEVIIINYNRSNTPKFVGKFTNVVVNNKLKRQCKKCPAVYTDLKGFNRHYQKKHLQ